MPGHRWLSGRRHWGCLPICGRQHLCSPQHLVDRQGCLHRLPCRAQLPILHLQPAARSILSMTAHPRPAPLQRDWCPGSSPVLSALMVGNIKQRVASESTTAARVLARARAQHRPGLILQPCSTGACGPPQGHLLEAAGGSTSTRPMKASAVVLACLVRGGSSSRDFL